MGKSKAKRTWYFIDEAGDPNFYSSKKFRGKRQSILGTAGCSPILMIGYIETPHAQRLRKRVRSFYEKLKSSGVIINVNERRNGADFLHATDNTPEVRYAVFQFIAELDFKAQFVIARKTERILIDNFDGNTKAFYDYLVSCALDDRLHRAQQNNIFIARRGNKREQHLRTAIEAGKRRFEKKHNKIVSSEYTLAIDFAKVEPCAWVVDYMNWAVYQAYTKGNMEYFEIVRDRVSFLQDIYDDEKKEGNKHLYGRKRNSFHINKATPLRLGD